MGGWEKEKEGVRTVGGAFPAGQLGGFGQDVEEEAADQGTQALATGPGGGPDRGHLFIVWGGWVGGWVGWIGKMVD